MFSEESSSLPNSNNPLEVFVRFLKFCYWTFYKSSWLSVSGVQYPWYFTKYLLILHCMFVNNLCVSIDSIKKFQLIILICGRFCFSLLSIILLIDCQKGSNAEPIYYNALYSQKPEFFTVDICTILFLNFKRNFDTFSNSKYILDPRFTW